ncbi:hypothetical protein IGI04_020942 [Brassica rapa subsp. trilocularis]|uniref:Uncharacterized protein n=1 Tax=Brassica rapa subsp. trilocularis TaxID=1813537 RepID=A0ABQ7MK61_BRACM|nr:hypothetical protein IGI04_020942 [Brassica rapa subsp. trilocularis]
MAHQLAESSINGGDNHSVDNFTNHYEIFSETDVDVLCLFISELPSTRGEDLQGKCLLRALWAQAQDRREMLEELMRKGTSSLGNDVPSERER